MAGVVVDLVQFLATVDEDQTEACRTASAAILGLNDITNLAHMRRAKMQHMRFPVVSHIC